MGDIEDSTQEPTVPFNMQPAAHNTGFSDFQLREVSSSTIILQWPTLILPAVFCHERTPSTSATLTAFNR